MSCALEGLSACSEEIVVEQCLKAEQVGKGKGSSKRSEDQVCRGLEAGERLTGSKACWKYLVGR